MKHSLAMAHAIKARMKKKMMASTDEAPLDPSMPIGAEDDSSDKMIAMSGKGLADKILSKRKMMSLGGGTADDTSGEIDSGLAPSQSKGLLSSLAKGGVVDEDNDDAKNNDPLTFAQGGQVDQADKLFDSTEDDESHLTQLQGTGDESGLEDTPEDKKKKRLALIMSEME